MLQSLSVDLTSFDISPNHGFLPDALPLQKFNNPYFELWEAIISHLPALLKNQSLRNQVNNLPILSTSRLTSEREWHRAYLILSFLTHAYIWEAGGPSQILPPAISVPFLDVSSHLELPPTATYAALNLWNFTTLSPWSELTLDNLRVLHTFTGTKDEEWFYLVSVAIEARGAKIIPVMLKAVDAAQQNNSSVVLSALSKFSDCVQEIGGLLKRMYEQCSPDVFYNQIRPFLAGSKNMMAAGLPHGVFYDEGNGRGRWHKYSGGSNAQSSLIQFFDVVLGVEHSSTKGSNEGFLKEMRTYMPGPHRRFLDHVGSTATLRPCVEKSDDDELLKAYNAAVEELGIFRDIHIQIVTRYIITPSRKNASTGNQGLNLAVASSRLKEMGALHGTGGTELLPFLRQSRDETKSTSLNSMHYHGVWDRATEEIDSILESQRKILLRVENLN